jgi:hypothetical protein
MLGSNSTSFFVSFKPSNVKLNASDPSPKIGEILSAFDVEDNKNYPKDRIEEIAKLI